MTATSVYTKTDLLAHLELLKPTGCMLKEEKHEFMARSYKSRVGTILKHIVQTFSQIPQMFLSSKKIATLIVLQLVILAMEAQTLARLPQNIRLPHSDHVYGVDSINGDTLFYFRYSKNMVYQEHYELNNSGQAGPNCFRKTILHGPQLDTLMDSTSQWKIKTYFIDSMGKYRSDFDINRGIFIKSTSFTYGEGKGSKEETFKNGILVRKLETNQYGDTDLFYENEVKNHILGREYITSYRTLKFYGFTDDSTDFLFKQLKFRTLFSHNNELLSTGVYACIEDKETLLRSIDYTYNELGHCTIRRAMSIHSLLNYDTLFTLCNYDKYNILTERKYVYHPASNKGRKRMNSLKMPNLLTFFYNFKDLPEYENWKFELPTGQLFIMPRVMLGLVPSQLEENARKSGKVEVGSDYRLMKIGKNKYLEEKFLRDYYRWKYSILRKRKLDNGIFVFEGEMVTKYRRQTPEQLAKFRSITDNAHDVDVYGHTKIYYNNKTGDLTEETTLEKGKRGLFTNASYLWYKEYTFINRQDSTNAYESMRVYKDDTFYYRMNYSSVTKSRSGKIIREIKRNSKLFKNKSDSVDTDSLLQLYDQGLSCYIYQNIYYNNKGKETRNIYSENESIEYSGGKQGYTLTTGNYKTKNGKKRVRYLLYNQNRYVDDRETIEDFFVGDFYLKCEELRGKNDSTHIIYYRGIPIESFSKYNNKGEFLITYYIENEFLKRIKFVYSPDKKRQFLKNTHWNNIVILLK